MHDEVNRRLAERLSSAGLSQSQVALSVLFLLPGDFVKAYEALYHKALKVDGDRGKGERIVVEKTEKRRDEAGEYEEGTWEYEEYDGVVKAKGARKTAMREGASLGQMPGAKKGKAYKQAWTVADEQALELKHKMDKRLRKMAREMRVLVDSGAEGVEREPQKKCTGKGCSKWLEHGWKWCPHCGTRQRAGRDKG